MCQLGKFEKREKTDNELMLRKNPNPNFNPKPIFKVQKILMGRRVKKRSVAELIPVRIYQHTLAMVALSFTHYLLAQIQCTVPKLVVGFKVGLKSYLLNSWTPTITWILKWVP